jgi:hypothetical protein
MSEFKEVVNRQYKLDAVPVADNSTVEEDFLEILSDQNPPNLSSQIRCQLKDVNSWTNPGLAYLELRVRIEASATGADTTDGHRVALANGVASLFSRTVCRINNVVVETNELANYSNHVKNLLEKSSDFQDSCGQNAGVYNDTNAHSCVAVGRLLVDPQTGIPTTTWNAGFYERQKLQNDDRTNGDGIVYHLPLKDLFGCCIDRCMMNNQFSVELTRAPDDFVLVGDQAATYRVSIKRCSLWMPRIRPSSLVEAQLYQMVSQGVKSNYSFNTWSCYNSANVPAGNSTMTQRAITQSERPLWVFTYATLAVDAKTTSPYLTQDFITDLQCRVNGKLYPSVQYSRVGTQEGKSRIYHDLCKYGGAEGINLPFTDFKYNTIVGFDVSKQTENLARSGNTIEIIASFGAGAGADLRLHTCVLSEKQFIMSYTGGNPVITML